MPVHTGKDSKGCYAQWGSRGKKYYYTCGNASARGRAKVKATKQGAAARASGYRGQSANGKDTGMKNGLQVIAANFTGVVRNDQMGGRDYLVAPMIMIVEGVLEGTNGPLLYPAEELGKTPGVWNTKPVIVYHPEANGQGVSACDPDILTNRQVGIIMNTIFEDGKLKAEAWLEVDRMNKVDERIAEAIENKQMMELSTGLFTDNEDTEGDWDGTHYDAIARNFRPDHLALLPDLKGACSIEDGAGFLRLNAQPGKVDIVGNAMSHGNIRSLLNSWLQDKDEDIWVEDVYDTFFIFMKDGKLFKGDYTIVNSVIEVVNEFEEVIRVTEYRTKGGAFVGNKDDDSNRKDLAMKEKKELVDALISNEATQWKEDDRKSLMALDEAVLAKMSPVQNEEEDDKDEAAASEASATGSDANKDEATAEKTTENQKPQTAEEYIKKAPPAIQDVLSDGLASHKADKARLIKLITANEKNQFTGKQLGAKSLAELKQLAALAANTDEQQEELVSLNFGGQAEATDTEQETPLALPTMNFGAGEEKQEAAA